MTIQEAGKNYDVSMNYWYDEDADLWGWAWTLNCGYQCWDSKYTQPSAKRISNPSSKHGQDQPSDLG